ncbi:MAG: hypothetical protein FWG74_06870 [Planctomycetes bacterium]|nr:hypothetical protein [Planctomycetota bacterium]
MHRFYLGRIWSGVFRLALCAAAGFIVLNVPGMIKIGPWICFRFFMSAAAGGAFLLIVCKFCAGMLFQRVNRNYAFGPYAGGMATVFSRGGRRKTAVGSIELAFFAAVLFGLTPIALIAIIGKGDAVVQFSIYLACGVLSGMLLCLDLIKLWRYRLTDADNKPLGY